MSGPLVTVTHDEEAVEYRNWQGQTLNRVGLDVHASITYRPEQTQDALAAVERIAENLRRQIADAAERTTP